MRSDAVRETGDSPRCRLQSVAMRIIAIIALTIGALATVGARAADAIGEERKVRVPSAFALGDIHGDFKTLRRLLRDAGVIDENDRWAAGGLHLFQTGDIVDRGAESRPALDLLMRLEKEAAAAGGKVVVTMGNHELWNVIGEHYYVSAGEYDAFAAEESPELRAARRRRILGLIQKPHPLLRSRYYQGLARTLSERAFDKIFRPGCFAHREAFSPEGHYGKWVLKRPIAHREHGILFVHAGISPKYAGLSVEEINRQGRDLIAGYLKAVRALEELGVYDSGLGWDVLRVLVDRERLAGPVDARLEPHFRTIEEFNRGLLMEEEGPLMYRGLALGSERLLAADVQRLLERNEVERIVIGHTQPKSLEIEPRFGNRVILIDTGLNQAVYKGRPSLLAIYPDGSLRVF